MYTKDVQITFFFFFWVNNKHFCALDVVFLFFLKRINQHCSSYMTANPVPISPMAPNKPLVVLSSAQPQSPSETCHARCTLVFATSLQKPRNDSRWFLTLSQFQISGSFLPNFSSLFFFLILIGFFLCVSYVWLLRKKIR